MTTLRDYQSLAVKHVTAASATRNRCYFVLPTGAGKTRVLAEVATQRIAQGRILFIAHRREIVDQAAATLRDVCNVEVGTAADGFINKPEAPVLVAMVQTLRDSRLRTYLKSRKIGTLLIDECHHVTEQGAYGKLIREVESGNGDVFVVGTTATPFREGRDRFQAMLPHCVFERTIPDMQAVGILAPLVPVSIAIETLRLDRIVRRSGEYAQPQLDEAMRDVVTQTAFLTSPYITERLSIAYAVSVAHAHALRDAYAKVGLQSFVIVGTTPRDERERIYDAWRISRGILCNVDVLSEGFDQPNVSAVVMAAPTQSIGRYLQRVGRAARLTSGKSDALIIDVTGGRIHLDDRQARFQSVFLHGAGGERETPLARGPRKLLTTPSDEGRNHWLNIGGVDVLPTGGSTFWSLRRDTSSGLWSANEHDGYLRKVAISGATLSDALETINASLSLNALTRKNAPWRTALASERSLETLENLDANAAANARTHRFTQGAVSDRISELRIGAYLAPGSVARMSQRAFVAVSA